MKNIRHIEPVEAVRTKIGSPEQPPMNVKNRKKNDTVFEVPTIDENGNFVYQNENANKPTEVKNGKRKNVKNQKN